MPLWSRRTLSQAWETHERFKLELDWNGDDSFSGDYDDLSSDVVGEVQMVRGREGDSQLTSRSVAGSLQATLRNDDGRYSSFNASSVIYGSIVPARKVRAWALTPYTYVLWTGFLDTIQPQTGGSEPRALLQASGLLKILGDQASRGYPTPQVDVLTGDVIDALLDSVDHPATARDIEDGGVPVGAWFTGPDGIIAAAGIQQMEEHEVGGWFYEGLDWDGVFETRYHRLIESAVSLAVFSDDPASSYPYIALMQKDSVREIYNEVTGSATPYTPQAIAALWSLTEQPYLAPGASITLTATYSAGGFVLPWTTPVSGVDVISATGTLVVTLVSSSGGHMTFTVTNSHATAAALLTTVQARGIAYTAGATTQAQSQDATSQALYRKRNYPLGSPWYNTISYAQAACDYFISRQKDPHPILQMAFTGTPSAELARLAGSLALSDRITLDAQRLLTELGIDDTDFYIESIAHSFGPAMPWVTVLQLSHAGVQQQFGIFDDTTYGKFDTTLIFAY